MGSPRIPKTGALWSLEDCENRRVRSYLVMNVQLLRIRKLGNPVGVKKKLQMRVSVQVEVQQLGIAILFGLAPQWFGR